MPARPRALTPDRSARHLFGAEMRRLREAAGMSLESLAGVTKFGKSSIARFETAEAMIPPELPSMLDAAFGTDGIFGKLYALARHEIHPDKFRRRMELEARAIRIREYSPQIVPGLIQTPAYAEAQFRVHLPDASDNEVEELLTARLSRQELLSKEPQPYYAAILDEGVLRRRYGSWAVMREQLTRLAESALTPASFVQVLPFEHGGHALAGGALSLLTLDDDSPVAYEEAITTGTLVEEKKEVRARIRAYDLLSASALSPEKSADFIRSVLEALPDEHTP